MKKMVMVMVGVAAAALSGCANMNMGAFGGGRYYQILNPMNDVVIMQADMTTDRGCRYMESSASPDLKPFVRCSGQSVAAELPWRAVAYNPSMAATFVFDAISEEACQSATSGMEKTAAETGSGGKVVMPCSKK